MNKQDGDELNERNTHGSYEAMPLAHAAHIYLWLVIRQVPPVSMVFIKLSRNLRDTLEAQRHGWWSATHERKNWLAWILFIGAAAAAGTEQWWFLTALESISESLGVWSRDSLKKCLSRVLWQDEFCADHCTILWNKISELQKLELATFDPANSPPLVGWSET